MKGNKVRNQPRGNGVRQRIRLTANTALLETAETNRLLKIVIAKHNETAIELHALKELFLEIGHTHPARSAVVQRIAGASAPIGLEPDAFQKAVAAVKEQLRAQAEAIEKARQAAAEQAEASAQAAGEQAPEPAEPVVSQAA